MEKYIIPTIDCQASIFQLGLFAWNDLAKKFAPCAIDEI